MDCRKLQARVLLVLLAIGGFLGAPSICYSDAAALGVAGAFSLSARGTEAPSWNPATLAWDPALDVQIVSGSVKVGNNSFTLDDYNRWNGATWDEDDKREILQRIGDSSLEGRFHAALRSPGVAWDRWAFTTETVGSGDAEVPREYFEFVLYGNRPERVFEFARSAGESFAATILRISRANDLEPRWGLARLSVGASLKLVQGWGYWRVMETEGHVATTADAVDGEVRVDSRTATGGSGIAIDLGAAGQTDSGWDFGVFLRNAPGRIFWNRDVQERRETVIANQVNLDDLEENSDLVETESSKRSASSFHQSLPIELSLAAGTRRGETYVEIDLRQGFSETAHVTKTPRLAIGASHPIGTWWTGRAGLALGGVDRIVLAAGFGVRVSGARIDLAYQILGFGEVFHPKGFAGGIAVSYRRAPTLRIDPAVR